MKRKQMMICGMILLILLAAALIWAHVNRNIKYVWNADGVRTPILSSLDFSSEEDYLLTVRYNTSCLYNGVAVKWIEEVPEYGLAKVQAFGVEFYVPADALVDKIPEGGHEFTLERSVLYDTNLLWLNNENLVDPYIVSDEQTVRTLPMGDPVDVLGVLKQFIIVRHDAEVGFIFYEMENNAPLTSYGIDDILDHPDILSVEKADQLARETLQKEFGLTMEEIDGMSVSSGCRSYIYRLSKYIYHFYPYPDNPNTNYQIIICAERGIVTSFGYFEADEFAFLG